MLRRLSADEGAHRSFLEDCIQEQPNYFANLLLLGNHEGHEGGHAERLSGGARSLESTHESDRQNILIRVDHTATGDHCQRVFESVDLSRQEIIQLHLSESILRAVCLIVLSELPWATPGR